MLYGHIPRGYNPSWIAEYVSGENTGFDFGQSVNNQRVGRITCLKYWLSIGLWSVLFSSE